MSLRADLNFNQKVWPGAGDTDDCAPTAAYRAIHACMPWLRLHGIAPFRRAAGVPDQPGPTGLTIAQTAKGIVGLYPELDGLISASTTRTWSSFMTGLKNGRVAVLFLLSGKLPSSLQFGFTGIHAVTVAYENGGLWLANPLAPPHATAKAISEAALKAAVQAYSGSRVESILMPTEEKAYMKFPIVTGLVDKALSGLQATIDEQSKIIADLKTQAAADKALADEQSATIGTLKEQVLNAATIERERIAQSEAERIKSL